MTFQKKILSCSFAKRSPNDGSFGVGVRRGCVVCFNFFFVSRIFVSRALPAHYLSFTSERDTYIIDVVIYMGAHDSLCTYPKEIARFATPTASHYVKDVKQM